MCYIFTCWLQEETQLGAGRMHYQFMTKDYITNEGLALTQADYHSTHVKYYKMNGWIFTAAIQENMNI